MFATARSIRNAEPASPPSARRGGTPSPGGSSIGSPPSRYWPGGMPAHAAASVTSTIRPGAAAKAMMQFAGELAQIDDQPAGQPVVGQRLAGHAGLAGLSGRCALNRCVTIRAPAAAAAATWRRWRRCAPR